MAKGYRWVWMAAMLSVTGVIACGGPASRPAAQPGPTGTVIIVEATPAPTLTTTIGVTATPIPTATSPAELPPPGSPAPTAIPTAAPTDTPTPEPEDPPTLIVVEISEGSRARYLVRERFARLDFPNDAIGETSDVTGTIVFNSDGVVQPDQSMLVVDLRTLRSDDDDRDDFLLGESLESERFPSAEFAVQEAPGLPRPLPQEGEGSFQLVGDMTLHNTTSPLTWDVTARFGPGQVTGTARTSFTFSTFRMVRPSQLFLLSVDDNIRLELDFIASVSEFRE